MEKLSMCRICLIKDVRLHCLFNTDLQEIYEFLSGNLLETKDTRPLHACYMCCARLRNCLQLRTACLHSEELFSHLLVNDSCEVTPSQSINMLQTTPVFNMNVGPVVHRELKMDSQMADEQRNEEQVEGLQDNIKDKGICTQFIKQDNMKSENVGSDDEEVNYSIQSIKVENNSASDDSCVGDGTPESYVSKSNPSISSVDLQDILGGKTVKVMLHRMDLNSFRKATTVTEHLKHNICKEYKQLVHTSSETYRSENSDSFKHMSTDAGDAIYKCRLCEKSFSKKGVLNTHIRRTHNNENPLRCPTCDKCFNHISNLAIHIRAHTGKKPFKCYTCGKYFSQNSNLLQHTRIHTGEKPYKCETCGKLFRHSSTLSIHVRNHADEKPYKCDTCGKGFSKQFLLLRHIPIHTGEKPYKCDTCGKYFSEKWFLSQHIRTHTGDRPYMCDTCGKRFILKSYLSVHIRRHSAKKPYNCDACGKGFIYRRLLLEHIRKHTGEKPYKCDKCGKGFIHKGYLSEHIRTHTGEKPYKCDTCGKRFKQKKCLSYHVFSKKYKCSQV